jgi:hypothetical protein
MKLNLTRKKKRQIESFKGFTKEDLELLAKASIRPRKHKKRKLHVYTCIDCGRVYYYKLLRCVECESKNIKENKTPTTSGGGHNS